MEFPGRGARGESVPEKSLAGGCAAVPAGGAGGPRQVLLLFLASLLRLWAQVPARGCSPVQPGVPCHIKTPSRVPESRPGHRGLSRPPAPPSPTSCCISIALPAPRKPPREGCRRGSQRPGPHPGVSHGLARAVPAPGPSRLRPHLASGCTGSEVGWQCRLGWWAREGYKCPPQAGPLLRKDMEPSSDQWGRRALPTGPDRLARLSHMLPSSPRSLGGGGFAEVGLLYLGISDELEKLLFLQGACRQLSGAWLSGAVVGARLKGQPRGPWDSGPPGSYVGIHGTVSPWAPRRLSCSSLLPFQPRGIAATSWPGLPFSSRAPKPGLDPKRASEPAAAPGVSGGDMNPPSRLEQARGRPGRAAMQGRPTQGCSHTTRNTPFQRGRWAPAWNAPTRGLGPRQPPPSSGIRRTMTWLPPSWGCGPSSGRGEGQAELKPQMWGIRAAFFPARLSPQRPARLPKTSAAPCCSLGAALPPHDLGAARSRAGPWEWVLSFPQHPSNAP